VKPDNAPHISVCVSVCGSFFCAIHAILVVPPTFCSIIGQPCTSTHAVLQNRCFGCLLSGQFRENRKALFDRYGSNVFAEPSEGGKHRTSIATANAQWVSTQSAARFVRLQRVALSCCGVSLRMAFAAHCGAISEKCGAMIVFPCVLRFDVARLPARANS
jgi:hypothetical protein